MLQIVPGSVEGVETEAETPNLSMVLCGWTEAGVYPDWNKSVFRAQYELVTLHASVTKCLTKTTKGRKG